MFRRREYDQSFAELYQLEDRRRDAQRWISWATRLDQAPHRTHQLISQRRSVAISSHNSAQVDTVKSLVCEACWSRLFSPESFQKIWFNHFRPSLEGEERGGVSYSTTRSEVFKSHLAGCPWCTLLERKYGDRLLRLDPRFVHTVYVGTTPTTEPMAMRGSHVPKGARSLQITINGVTLSYLTYASAGDNASSYTPARDFILPVGSSRSTKLAQQCMERCTRAHPQCPKPQPAMLPSRVIDCTDIQWPKLVLSGGLQGRYAALSYVWGGPQFCTTTGNIHTLVHKGIDKSILPQTIVDAIGTTLNLGIPYLWVDALCILQDSETDKDAEIGRMQEIYRDAYVTIIAASSAKAVDGFLQDRPAPCHPRLPFHCPDGRLGTFSILQDAHTESEDAEPVDTRAQHYNLSAKQRLSTLVMQFVHRANSGGFPTRFSSLQSDKLVAFAGIAEQFHIAWGDEYMAGLWRRNLLAELLWKRHKRRLRPKPKDPHYAPSWSWAATEGEIMAFDGLVGPKFDIPVSCGLCEVVSCEVMPRSPQAPFGGVKTGMLTITAQVFPVDRAHRHPRITDTFDVGSCEQCLAWVESDCREDEFPWSDKAYMLGDNMQCITAYSACVEWLDVLGHQEKVTFAIPVAWNEGGSSVKQRMIVGILVERIQDPDGDAVDHGERYRRIGYFETKPGLVWHFHNDPRRRRLVTLL